MGLRGHQEIYGGDEGLRHHLCVSHGEHLDEGASREHMDELHEDEHPSTMGHRGEWGCHEHDPSEEPTEFHDMHESGGIGEIHRGIGVSLPDGLHRFVHDPSKPAHERARALMDHVSGHPEGGGHLGTHWTTENRVAEGFAETAGGWKRDEDDRTRPEHDHSFGTHEEESDGETERTRMPKPGTAVVFHAHEPHPDVIDRDPHRPGNGDVYGYSEHGEREVPIASSHDLDLRGVSWAQVHHEDDPKAPFLTEYAHHDFGDGHEHTAAVQAAALLEHFEAAGDYRISHTAPSPDAGHLPLHHYTGDNPGDHVQIYRAAPGGTESINPGDWVSLSADYAHRHARQKRGPDWPVYTASVPQEHVHWDENDNDEHGYNGPPVHHPDVHDEDFGANRDWDDYHEEHPYEAAPEPAKPKADPAAKARRDESNRRQHEHAWRVTNDPLYRHHKSNTGDGSEWERHWFPQGLADATGEQIADEDHYTRNAPEEMLRRIHGTVHEAAGDDYHTRHRPGGEDYGAPFHDVEDMMPDYHDRHPSLYDNHARAGEPWVSNESDEQLRHARGNPEADVSIYRALPREHREINSGDWVSTSANYARQHAESNLHTMPWAVIKSTVKAKHLFTEGDMNEWGYHGPDISGAKVHVHGGPRKQAAAEAVAHPEEAAAMPRTAGRQQEGDERAFGGYTMRYRTDDLGERKPRHVIEAHTPDGTRVGELNWYGTTGTVHHVGVAGPEDKPGGNWGDGRDHRRRGLASAMWDWSQEMTPKAKHSNDRTGRGKEWVRGLKKPRKDPPSLPDVVAHFEEPYAAPPQEPGGTWRHLQDMHGVRLSADSDREPGAEFTSALHRKLHGGRRPFPGAVPHHHDDQPPAAAPSRPPVDISKMFTPIPEAELEEQRRAREPKPERTDDREYSVRDVSRHYDWEGFDPQEISHLVHRPEHATFTREDIPVKSLRHADGQGRLVPPPSYRDIAGQGEEEKDRLEALKRGYDNGDPVPPIVAVRDGEHHIIADGSHRAAVHAEHGQSHIPAFVTQRTIPAGQHTAAVVAHFEGETPHPRTDEEMRAHLEAGTSRGGHGLEPEPGEDHWEAHHDDHYQHPGEAEHRHEAFYHGTSLGHPDEEDPPEHIFPQGGSHLYPGEHTGEHAFATTSPSTAWDYADKAYRSSRGQQPRVLRVRPTGPFEEDPSHHPDGQSRSPGEGSVRSGHPWAVTGEEEIPEHLWMRSDDDWGEHEASLGKEAAVAALANPHDHGHDWYHGSPHKFGDFGGDGPDSRLAYEDNPEDTSHWNTLVGHHFAASHAMAEEFSKGEHGGEDSHGEEGPAQNVVHARLELKNPRHYASEHDMDQEAYEHEWKAGNHHDAHHDPEELANARENGWEDELAPTYQYAGHSDRMRRQDEHDETYMRQNRQFHPYATGWLNAHPDKYGIAQRFRERLQAAGHDGITYGNEFEHKVGNGKTGNAHVCAIPLHGSQIDVTQRHSGPGCLPQRDAERQWPGRSQPMLPGLDRYEGSLDVIAHFEAGASGPYMQQKLFHAQPDPSLHAPDSGRHNPEDPEAHLRHRSEHDEDYQPDGCEHCGGDMNFPRDHAEQHQSWLHRQDWHTDWDEVSLPDTLHRGIGVSLPDHVHNVVHDESRPVHERAQALADHVLHGPGAAGLGNFWSSDPDVSKNYAESSARRYAEHNDQTPVMLHARTPDREHIETDPDTLREWGVYSHHLAGNEEVPVSSDAPLHVRGISWAPPRHGHHIDSVPKHLDDDHAWTRHDFGDEGGFRAHASLPVVAHFGEADSAENPPCHYCGDPLDDSDVSDGASAHDECDSMRWCEPHQEHHDDPAEAESHNSTYTDWGGVLPFEHGIHRGLVAELPAGTHAAVHDASRPAADRASALVRHLAENPEDDSEGGTHAGALGVHWTDHEPTAQAWGSGEGAMFSPRGHDSDPRFTHVVLHAASPDESHLEDDPDELDSRNMYGFNHEHSEREVPLKAAAPVHLTGISWKHGGESEWNRHDFGQGSERTGALDPSGADLSRMVDRVSDEQGAAHQDDLKHVPDWGPLHKALPPAEHDGWMFMQRNLRTGPHQIVTYKHGITRGYLHADQQGRAWQRQGDDFTGPHDARQHLEGKGHYRDLRSLGAAPDTAYDDDYRAGRNKALRGAGYEVVEGRAPGGHTAAVDSPQVPSFTHRYETYGRDGTYVQKEREVSGPFYHGSRSKRLQPGDEVRKGMKTNDWGDEGERSQWVHFTTDQGGAASYAQRAGGHLYEVEPTGEVKQGYAGNEWKSEHPLRVIRRVGGDEMPGREAAVHPGQDEDGKWFYGHEPAHLSQSLPEEMHRGVGFRLSPDVHAVVHDESRPLHERAHALLSHLDEHSAQSGKYGDGGVGIHWSVNERTARGFAVRRAPHADVYDFSSRDPHSTQVVFHAQTASPAQMLRSKRKLDEHEIFGLNHGEGEIPLKKRSTVKLTGISWAPNGDKDAPLTRHDFPQPVKRGAGTHVAPAEGEAEMFGRRTASRELVLGTACDTVPADGPFAPVIEAASLLGSWEPASLGEAYAALRDLGLVFTALHQGTLRAARITEDLPVDPEIPDVLHDMASGLLRAAEDHAAAARVLPPEDSWEDPPARPNR